MRCCQFVRTARHPPLLCPRRLNFIYTAAVDRAPPSWLGVTYVDTKEDIDVAMAALDQMYDQIYGPYIDSLVQVGVAEGIELTHREVVVPGGDGQDMTLFISRPKGSEGTPLPCVYHIHGGGMVLLSAAGAMYFSRGRLLTPSLQRTNRKPFDVGPHR